MASLKLSNRQASELLGILRLTMSVGIGRKAPPTEMDVAMILALDMGVKLLAEQAEQEKALKAMHA